MTDATDATMIFPRYTSPAAAALAHSIQQELEQKSSSNRFVPADSGVDRTKNVRQYFIDVLCDYLGVECRNTMEFPSFASDMDVIRTILSKNDPSRTVTLDQAEIEFLKYKLASAFDVQYARVHALFQDKYLTGPKVLSTLIRENMLKSMHDLQDDAGIKPVGNAIPIGCPISVAENTKYMGRVELMEPLPATSCGIAGTDRNVTLHDFVRSLAAAAPFSPKEIIFSVNLKA